jgi:hypothetical protein
MGKRNFWHAAAFVLMGWLLISPPIKQDNAGNLSVETTAPHSNWSVFGDGQRVLTQAECMEYRYIAIRASLFQGLIHQKAAAASLCIKTKKQLTR